MVVTVEIPDDVLTRAMRHASFASAEDAVLWAMRALADREPRGRTDLPWPDLLPGTSEGFGTREQEIERQTRVRALREEMRRMLDEHRRTHDQRELIPLMGTFESLISDEEFGALRGGHCGPGAVDEPGPAGSGVKKG